MADYGVNINFRVVGMSKVDRATAKAKQLEESVNKNNTNKSLVLTIIPSVSPGLAAEQVKKIQCFCFEEQTLGPYEEQEWPIRFYVDSELSENVNNIYLSYTLFENNLFELFFGKGYWSSLYYHKLEIHSTFASLLINYGLVGFLIYGFLIMCRVNFIC